MKKWISMLVCISLLLSVGVLLTPAAALSSEVNDSTWSSVELKALWAQDSNGFFSDLADEYYYDDFFSKEIPELDGEEMDMGTLSMRGFSMTPDHKYALLGHLSGAVNITARGCALYDFETGTVTDIFYRYDEENAEDPNGIPFSHPKGIAADDRGNVYVGFAFSKNYNVVHLGIAHIDDETKTFEELSMSAVYEYGEPGDEGGIQVGVNGVEVVKIGEEYYCYIMTNYAYDALYCYNVTDPANPYPNTDFGEDGVIVFSEEDCAVKGDGFTLNDGDYLAVDEEGIVWLAAGSKEGSRGVMKIAADGSACLDVVAATKAYSVCRAGDYLIVGDKDGELLHVYDVSDTSAEIASISLGEDVTCGARFARVQVCEDILFVLSSQESTTLPNTLLAAALTADAEVELSNMVKALNGELAPVETETDSAETDPAETDPVETDPVETDPVETDPVETDPVETDPVETDPVETDPAETDPVETNPAGDDSATEPAGDDSVTEPAGDDSATEPAGDDSATEPAGTTADTTAGTTASTTAGTDAATTAAEDDGCSSVIGMGAAALVLSAMAAAVALKKKH